jgi:phosphate transport system substrate-binding protein
MSTALRSLLFALSCGAGLSAAAQDIEIRLHGSNTLGSRLGPELLEAYARANGYVGASRQVTAAEEYRIEGRNASGQRFVGLVKAHGTNTGYSDLVSGAADVWMASRPAKSSEIEQASAIGDLGAVEQEHVVALDGLALIVHPDNPIDTISVSAARAIFTGAINDWSQVGGRPRAIARYGRDAKSGTFDSFKSMILGDGPQLTESTRRFESSEALEKAVAGDPAAIGFVGFSYVSGSKLLAVEESGTLPLKPDRMSVATEDYLLARRLYFYVPASANAQTRRFLDFVHGREGQAVVDRVGFVAQNIFVGDSQPLAGQPDDYYAMVAEASRLSLNLRFRPRSSTLDSRALRDLDRLREFMADPGNRGMQLRLAAFGLPAENSSRVMTLLTINDRVDHVSQMLAAKGIPIHRSRIIVGGAAVAPTDRPETRERNERVELWLVAPKRRPTATSEG